MNGIIPCFACTRSDKGSYRRHKPRNEQGCMSEQQAMLATSSRQNTQGYFSLFVWQSAAGDHPDSRTRIIPVNLDAVGNLPFQLRNMGNNPHHTVLPKIVKNL